MPYIHQVGSVKVGEVVRYTITYTPSKDTLLPLPDRFHVRVRNTEAVALRAAIIPGPYLLSVSAYPAVYDPLKRLQDPESHGIPQFEPQVKAGSTWEGELLVPREIQQAAISHAAAVSWVVEITSQTIFAKSASVGYELSVSSNTQFLESRISSLSFGSGRRPGKLQDHQRHMRATGEPSSQVSFGIFSEAIKLKVEDTAMLWNSPPLVKVENRRTNQARLRWDRIDPPRQKKVHLVVLTHGLQCNLTADMLFMKETIDAVARKARESRGAADNEEIIVRGYSDNATRTQRGVEFLGKRVAKYVLSMTYPDQPVLPTGRTRQDGFAQGVAGDHHSHHHHAHPYAPHEYRDEKRQSYKITSISFIGHSLGGPTQVFALAYIQRHCPTFFDLIKPRNFITVASPMMGIGAESAPYVRLALETGLVGITGRDLGLSWGINTVVRNRWGAFLGSQGQSVKTQGDTELATEPLLRILPSGLAHTALKRFDHRTVYANTVNDGIVPLRTSSLLFLDWQSLEKVERAQRDANFIESIVVRAWREMTGASSKSSSSHRAWKPHPTQVPQPSELDGPVSASQASVPSQLQHALRMLLAGYPKDTQKTSPREHGSEKYISKRHRMMLSKGQILRNVEMSNSPDTAEVPGPSQSQYSMLPEIHAPPETSFFEWVGDLMNSAVADMEHIIDPAKRPKTILHDRLYRPSDIPPLQNLSDVRVEEKIARSYHCDMPWRKVLVRLEPDAHISICVRRMFPDSQGWPVLKHLADAHFGASDSTQSEISKPLEGEASSSPGEKTSSEAFNADINLLIDNETNPQARKRQESSWLDSRDDDCEDDNVFRNLARTGRQFKAATWYAGKRLI